MFFLEIDLPPVLDRGLHLDLFGGAPVVEIGPNFWGARNETKNNPQLAESYSSSQIPTAREIEGCS